MNNKTYTIMIKEPGKEIRFEEVKAKYRYQALKNYIEGSKEYIYLNRQLPRT